MNIIPLIYLIKMSMFNRKIKLQFNKMKYAPLLEDSNNNLI